MSEQEMRAGLLRGATLIQEDWSSKEEIQIADKMLQRGHAILLEDWHYSDNFQCSYRKLKGTMK